MRCSLLLIVCVGFLSACKTSTAPDGDNTIAGLVMLFDTNTVALSDFSGVSVSVDGTNRKTMSDAIGHFQFDHLANGTYSITATKQGFGTYHWYQQQVINGRIDLPQALFARMSQATPVLDSENFDPVSGQGFYIHVHGSDNISTSFYCDLDSSVPPDGSHLAVLNSNHSIRFATGLLLSSGARSGDTLYFTCSYAFAGPLVGAYYPEGYTYYDPMHRETRYSSCGPRSNVVRAVMP